MIFLAAALLAIAPAPAQAQRADAPYIEDPGTCTDECEFYIPAAYWGEYAPTSQLCSGTRFYITHNQVGYTDGRFTDVEDALITTLDGHMVVSIHGAASIFRPGAPRSNEVESRVTMIFNRETNRLSVHVDEAPIESYVRCSNAAILHSMQNHH